MPIIRKILKVGHSLAVTVPKSWITNFEKETGQKITELALEVNGILKISPVFDKEKDKNGSTDTPAETL